jgi:hypothetical protein
MRLLKNYTAFVKKLHHTLYTIPPPPVDSSCGAEEIHVEARRHSVVLDRRGVSKQTRATLLAELRTRNHSEDHGIKTTGLGESVNPTGKYM